MMKHPVLAAILCLLAGAAAQAEPSRITTRPGPFRGYTQTEVRQGNHVTRCTTRPGPFKGQTVTDCR
jgi:hypothetical protein